MTEIYQLDDGTSSIGISPVRGENVPEDRIRQVIKSKDQRQAVYEWGGKQQFEIPFNNLDKIKATQLITWWQNMTTLTLAFPSDPGDSFNVKIDNLNRPPQMWGGDWDTLFAGIITVHEISSISFSSSSQSVSASRSCSSFPSSKSCSNSSSRSCELFLIFTSRSSSVGFDVVRSCSTSFSYSASCSYSTSYSYSTSNSWSDSQSSWFSWSSYVGGGYSHLSSYSHGSSLVQSSSKSGSSSRSCSSSRSGSSSCSNSSSQSIGVRTLLFFDSSCSDDIASSCSVSAGGSSCSISGVG